MEKSVLCCEKFSGKMLTHELGKIIPESEKTIADKSGAIAGSDMSIGFFGIQDAPELNKQQLVLSALWNDVLVLNHIVPKSPQHLTVLCLGKISRSSVQPNGLEVPEGFTFR